ncbi:hypothetical protein, unlikely [Trypanosoma brucei gambiense DAL972]|uniref:Uncharacterized protein n=1 Tax=Trypanosoma brucei gambiense (strain MHOM/CI/86/DAL972) TaxID=679716 RepID=C9ZRM9_TRYB9|nr:hypothetical protein, unlikely [Trypanosoma brucei gambiense DAL972]CBH12331.1 hypothetical protein, unlikely [Trypanosoma brucei gambiense DAL972]|eukprot:XP_011774612.1 hypothetical protein, unlikely [Trypanosoma brucei gambiense DAL972]
MMHFGVNVGDFIFPVVSSYLISLFFFFLHLLLISLYNVLRHSQAANAEGYKAQVAHINTGHRQEYHQRGLVRGDLFLFGPLYFLLSLERGTSAVEGERKRGEKKRSPIVKTKASG